MHRKIKASNQEMTEASIPLAGRSTVTRNKVKSPGINTAES